VGTPACVFYVVITKGRLSQVLQTKWCRLTSGLATFLRVEQCALVIPRYWARYSNGSTHESELTFLFFFRESKATPYLNMPPGRMHRPSREPPEHDYNSRLSPATSFSCVVTPQQTREKTSLLIGSVQLLSVFVLRRTSIRHRFQLISRLDVLIINSSHMLHLMQDMPKHYKHNLYACLD